MSSKRRYRKKRTPKADNYKPPFKQEILTKSVDTLTLGQNTQKLLADAGISTILDVVKRQDKDFYKISTFNKRNLFDLKNALKKQGLYLKPVKETMDTEDNKDNKNNESRRAKQKDSVKSGVKEQERRKTHPKQNRERKAAYVEVTKVVRPKKPVVEAVKDIPDIYVKVNKNGKWGFKNRAGKQVVDSIYDEVFNFKEELCCVQKDDLYGFINRDGQVVIPLVYSCATSFSEGLACVFKGEKCGYIDTENNVVVNFDYDAGTMVIDGECRVKKDGKWGELHIRKPSKNDDSVGIGVENIRWII